MVAKFTVGERQFALGLLVAMALLGLAMAALGAGDAMGVHGFIILFISLALVFVVGASLEAPAPTEDRTRAYYDDPIKVGIVLAMIWAVIGMGVGDWVAWMLAYPDLRFDAPWSSFGRMRPVHTTGVIFGFGGNALIATSMHVMQRTCRARLAGQISPWFVIIGYNLFVIIAVSGYVMGVTQSKEYAEPEWYADIWLVIVWVTYFGLYLRTLARRNEPHIYVANWYYLAFILVVAVLHIVNN
ncbi:MAG: cbb3-type cytochrome c oxidase subunit I, partial [Sedimentitalea sp.]|nr:cbb3-type cytochrome c oxidase subunit I [Sedimentitalea sp.]